MPVEPFYRALMTEEPLTIVEPPAPGGTLFVFREQERPGGGPPRTIAFTDVDIVPRSYEELAAARLHEPITIPLQMFNGRIVETDVEGVDTSRYAHVTTTLISPFTARAIGLVRGGWLPSGLAATRDTTLLMPDRNIVTAIAGRSRGKSRARDFLDLFRDRPVQVSPLLYALEGNGRALPTPHEARQQLAEAIAKLGEALPQARLMVGPESAIGLLGLIEDSRATMAAKQKFLIRLAPALAAPVSRRDRDTRWNDVLVAAADCGVAPDSLVVLAALSVVVHPGACAPRRLLKLHAGYDEADAYNALSDIRSLELLLYSLALQPGLDTQLCTADRALALFWVGLNATEIEAADDGIRWTLQPHDAILPEPFAARWAAEVNGTG